MYTINFHLRYGETIEHGPILNQRRYSMLNQASQILVARICKFPCDAFVDAASVDQLILKIFVAFRREADSTQYGNGCCPTI